MGRNQTDQSQGKTLQSGNKIGFHYFQDTAHYTNKDLNQWLPELINLNAGWLVLQSDATRAIPEQFIHGLIQQGITPIVHFNLRLPDAPAPADLHAILEAYAHWGVKFVVLFNTPNLISSWSQASWSQQDLVERFIDRFLPLAMEATKAGLTPVFPPLEPGGDYWDTSFLRSALSSIKRRGYQSLLNKMPIAATSYTFNHDLNWGDGGPEKWQEVKPYFTPANSEDQCGFNNYQWVEATAKSIGMKDVSIFQFGCGMKSRIDTYSPIMHAEIVQSILDRMGDPRFSSVVSSNFWLLAAEPGTEEYSQAWFKTDGKVSPIVRILNTGDEENIKYFQKSPMEQSKATEPLENEPVHPVEHYLLLPAFEWGVAEWYLEVARPFIVKHKPAIGFSIEEASLAKKVTIVGGDKFFNPEAVAHLRSTGCEVEQISGDGTSIATLLAER
jgi:hypothetical protein